MAVLCSHSMRGAVAWLALGTLVACAPEPSDATSRPAVSDLTVEVVSRREVVPDGGDGAPRLTLALVRPDGARVAIEGEATHYALFRDGAAVLRTDGSLELVSVDDPSAPRVLARESGPPARDERGSLLYVARYGHVSELHRLTTSGSDHVIAENLVGIGVLAPQRDGRVLFVASVNGGVAGLWVADDAGARCLTNCALRTGRDWEGEVLPVPTSASAMAIERGVARWRGADGEGHAIAIGIAVGGAP